MHKLVKQIRTPAQERLIDQSIARLESLLKDWHKRNGRPVRRDQLPRLVKL